MTLVTELYDEARTLDSENCGSVLMFTKDRSSDSDKSADKGSDKTDKTETVYAKADSSGKIYDVSVEAVLKNEGEGEITDYSTLSDIKNTEVTKNLQRSKQERGYMGKSW